MTEPTQAQIDAAAIAIIGLWKKPYNFEAMAKAALTAASEVGDTAIAVWMGKHGYATGHGDTIEDMLNELHAATIERCAQVAERVADENLQAWTGDRIAAAIRALATQP